ncbi:Leg1-related protein, partial [Kibdelosporangium lantanae]
MSRPVGHPVELAELDLYDVWTTTPALTDRFDPFSFPQRMAAYRALVHASNPNNLFGPDNRGNPLWGLVLQTQWQFRSGRLGTHSRQDGRIDPDAAWGYGNYSVNV